MISCILYSTDGCHLCDVATAIIAKSGLPISLTTIDIMDDDALVKHYKNSIPVLKRVDNGNLLYWPFAQQQLKEFMT